MTALLCPLCSQPRFNNLESLRLSLIHAATQNISCPICDDILMGLDKLTIHLFGHSINQNTGTGQNLSEVNDNQTAEDSFMEAKTEVQHQLMEQPVEHCGNYSTNSVLNAAGKVEKYNESGDRFLNELNTSCGGKIFLDEDVESKNDNLCTVNMEDLSFLMSWENNVKPRQEDCGYESRDMSSDDPGGEKQHNCDLSQYMSDLLNKKLPILNFTFSKNDDEGIQEAEDTNTKQFKCTFCGIEFETVIALSMHQDLVHSKSSTNQKNCEQASNDENLEVPKTTSFVPHDPHGKEPEFLPDLLNNNLNQSNKCVRDVTSSTTDEPQTKINPGESNDGNDNNISNSNRGELNFDMKLPHYDCHLCSKSFKMKGSLLVHFRVAHFALQGIDPQPVGDSNSSEERNHPCPICGKSFKKEQHLSQHIKTHEGKQWQCETCNKHFTTKYFLKKHQRLHTGEMPYSCPTCNKTFTFQQSYHKHLLYHSDEKPHQCNQCGRSFKELSTLHNHQRIHSGEKPFACETCGKCFRQRVSYIVHQRIHTGVLPYQCTACKKKFRYKVSQRSHKCTSQPPGIVIRQPDIVQKILENKHMFYQNII